MTIQSAIEQKLLAEFEPQHLEVLNESHMHRVAPGSETHFKVVLVTSKFDGQRLIQRHRQVNALLANELRESIHALALHTYTPHEWQEYFCQAPDTPRCSGSKITANAR